MLNAPPQVSAKPVLAWIKITRYVYEQGEHTNCPVDNRLTSVDETIEKIIERCYPSHAPIEKYNGWGKGNVYIGCLAHTFLVESYDGKAQTL